jgi:hypothetical protein
VPSVDDPPSPDMIVGAVLSPSICLSEVMACCALGWFGFFICALAAERLSLDEVRRAAIAARYVVVAARSAVLSVITGGGKWVEILAHADPLYQHLIVSRAQVLALCGDRRTTPVVWRRTA